MHPYDPYRRSVLFALTGLIAGSAAAQGARPAPQRGDWETWKAAFLAPEGRVIDDGQEAISHSEGQAYGLLLAQAFGDREAFERIEGWTQRRLATRQDALMAWKWQAGAVGDWRNATDGDLLRGWALLRAGRDSGWTGHADKVGPIARAIAEICLAPDPRAPKEPLLKPSDQSLATAETVLVNPSYYVPRAMIELGEATGVTALVRAAAHGETLLRDPRALRDWVSVTREGPRPPEGLADRFGWDALRIPLYLAWSGRWRHPAMNVAARRFSAAPAPGHVATVTGPDAHPLVQSNAPGFLAVAALAARRAPPASAGGTAQGYYPATLALLAQVARAEGGDAEGPH
ncbi:glycosyl hydrolase family 8 [Salipiger mucosus]|uniref:cellulase n=1 Tax=Salipiger mucosus DSM 16094 TaxID=1123237 RepID=S9Q9F4_9RHOB|nr:glycosyl hydrolase family 8 [Salipiger mucosus]EPX76587.1 Endoglucanase precursor [Salipiger mucosus DSM 16094]